MLIIVAIVLFFVLPSPWGAIALAVGIPLWLAELFAWNQTVKRRRRTVGAQTLIGRDAVVVTTCRPDGQVRLDGETWAASSSAGASIGETVRVVGRKHLTLVVEPAGPRPLTNGQGSVTGPRTTK